MPTATSKVTPSVSASEIEAQLATLLSTKAVSAGSKNYAAMFEKIARENGNVVTFDQAKLIVPKSPSDLAYYFRQAGGKIVSERGKSGGTRWVVVKLASGELGYPAAVKAEIDRLKSALEAAKK